MNSWYYILMGGGVLVASISQIFLKKSAQKKHASFIKEYWNKLVLVGYFMLFASMCIAIVAYRVVPLKYGAIIESLGYVFILLLSKVFLNEKITKKKLMGILLIILGVIVFSLDLF